MLITVKTKSHISELNNMLSSEFEMKDLGAAKKILGMEIYKDRKVVAYSNELCEESSGEV